MKKQSELLLEMEAARAMQQRTAQYRDQRYKRRKRSEPRVTEEINEQIQEQSKGLWVLMNNFTMWDYIFTPQNQLVVQEDSPQRMNNEMNVVPNIGHAAVTFSYIQGFLPEDGLWFLNQRSENAMTTILRTIIDNSLDINEVALIIYPKIIWEHQQQQLFEDVNLNGELRQQRERLNYFDQPNHSRWMQMYQETEGGVFFNQDYLNNLFDGQDFRTSQDSHYFYNNQYFENNDGRQKQQELRTWGDKRDIYDTVKAKFADDAYNNDSIMIENIRDIVTQAASQDITNDQLQRIILGVLNLRITNQREICRFRNAFDVVQGQYLNSENKINYQNMTNLTNQQLQNSRYTYFDINVALPFRMREDLQQNGDIIQPFITEFVRKIMITSRFMHVDGVGYWSPALYLALYQVFAVKIQKLCYSLIFHMKTRGITIARYLRRKFFDLDLVRHLVAVDQNERRITSIFRSDISPGPLYFTRRRDQFFGLIRLFFQKLNPRIRDIMRDEIIPIMKQRLLNDKSLAEGVIAITKQPSNIVQVNTRLGLNYPELPSYVQYKQLFNQYLQNIQQFIAPQFQQIGRRPFQRGVSFQAIQFTSDICDIDAIQPFVRRHLTDQIISIMERLNRGENSNQVLASIESYTIFLGFQFVQLKFNHEFYPVHRTNGLVITLDKIEKDKRSTELPIYFSRITAQPKVDTSSVTTRSGGFVYQNRAPPGKFEELEQWSIIQAIIRSVTTQKISVLAQKAWQVSGDGQDMGLQDEIFSLNTLTVFSAPKYQPGVIALPLMSELKFAPVIQLRVPVQLLRDLNTNSENTLNQLKQYCMMDYDRPQEETIQKIKCVQRTIWSYGMSFAQIKDEYEHAYQLSVMIRDMIESVQHKGDINIGLMNISVLLKNAGVNETIWLFIIDSCELIPFCSDLQRRRQKVIQLLDPGSTENIQIIAISSNTKPAHCFMTDLNCVKTFLESFANKNVRDKKYMFGSRDCFTLFKQQIHPQKPKVMNQLDNKQNIMSAVWALDIETTNSRQKPMQPYCIVITGENKQVIYSCMGNPQDVQADFSQFLKELKGTRNPKSPEIIIYAHNGAKFDWVILMRIFLRVFNDMIVFGRYADAKYTVIPSINLKLADFYLMVSQPLGDIARIFGTDTQQQQCEEIKEVQSYQSLNNETRKKILEYCIADCQCLWESIQKFTEKVVEILKPQGKQVLRHIVLPSTSSQLAMNIFSSKYLGKASLQGNVYQQIDEIQSQAYFGGVTQVFNFSKQFNVRYIDVNSLYPAAMRKVCIQAQPATINDIMDFSVLMKFPEYAGKGMINIHDLYLVHSFEFFPSAIGMLPERTQQGGLCYPRTSSKPLWRTGHEIRALINSQMLQRIYITKKLVYRQQQPEPIFKQYIDDFYLRKSTSDNPVQQQLYKLLLNQLYGQFAQRVFDVRKIVPTQTIINDPQLPQKIAACEMNATVLSDLINGHLEKSDITDLYFNDLENVNKRMKYVPQVVAVNRLDQDQGNQFMELVFQKSPLHMQEIGYLKRISVAITGASRAIMIEAMGQIYKQYPDNIVNHLFYMDTDSFFLSQEAYNILHDANLIDQKEIGQFKDEYPHPNRVRQVKFFAAKVYYYRVHPTEKISQWNWKFKGLGKKTFEQKSVQQNMKVFQDMLDASKQQQIAQQRWKRDFSNIKISDITQKTISQPRRLVNPDGTTKFYEQTIDFQTDVKKQRLVFNTVLNIFEYQELEK